MNPFEHMGLAHLAARRFAWTDPQGNDHDDMAQEAAMIIVRAAGPGRYDPSRGAFSTYAMTAATRRLADKRLKKRRLRTCGMTPDAIDRHRTDDDATERGVICAELWARGMHLAKPRERQMLDCLFVRGMTLKEASVEMGLTKQGVHQIKIGFIKKMRRMCALGG